MTQQVQEIPLFPLNVVLLPNMVLPLHIFEERYKQMISMCLENDSRFGVVLIKEGPEVGGTAIPHETGTIAHVTRVTYLSEGRMTLVTLGEHRFKLETVTQQAPYLMGKVRIIDPEDVGDPPTTDIEIEELQATLESYLKSLLGLQGGWVRKVESPMDPVALSFYIATVLRGNNDFLQTILESPSAAKRLNILKPVLDAAARKTQHELRQRMAREINHLN
ncbi:MAG: hypothetical protein BZY82_00005 [SAR202 cluster bacterium Io17-Chloro-G3]|nr:MAG: hypothetical protein BZY82_00005 [SAR202 cluster bacterium Io17-Chloro-G3]